MEISRTNKRIHIEKYLFTLILLCSLVFPFSGCTAPDTTTAQDEENGKSFIWKISSEDSYVYLLGSIHVASPDIYPLDSSIEDAFQESDKLVVEININEVSPLKSLLLIEKYGAYPAGQGLRESLPEPLYMQLESVFSEMGIPLLTVNDYRPWVVVMMMEGLVVGEGDYSAEYGIDMHFLDRAADRDMEILELESAEYQFELLSGLPDELMILVLEMSFEEPVSLDDIDIMFELWEKGDAEGMVALMLEDVDAEPGLAPFYDAFFTERNHNMVAEIEEYLADEFIHFIVVGAGHMGSEEGLINLLDEAGYIVEQL